MKAQLSLEFLVYAAVLAASLVASLASYAWASSRLRLYDNTALSEQFAALVNLELQYAQGSFTAVLPHNACAPAASASSALVQPNASIGLPGGVLLANSLCGMHGPVRLELRWLNGTPILR